MQRITANQQLEEGRKYLCRGKQPYTNGTFGKPRIESVSFNREGGGYRLRQLGGNWAYDAVDSIISYDGRLRIANLAGVTYNDVEKAIRDKPFQDQYFNIPVEAKDYAVSSQALEQWDVIGPIPEVNIVVLNALFEHPELIEVFNKDILIHPNGGVAVIVNDVNVFTREQWEPINDELEIRIALDIIKENSTPIRLSQEQLATAPQVWNGGEPEIQHMPMDEGRLPPLLADNLDKEFIASLGRLEHLQLTPDTNPNNEPEIEVIGTCGRCHKEMAFNVPRLGEAGGFIHKDTGNFECLSDDINPPTGPAGPDEHGFVTTESCGDKVYKQIRLTEKKHNQFGYYNEGAILIISEFDEKLGYCAGIVEGVKTNYPITSAGSIKPVFRNIVNIGFDGFEFVD